MVASNQFCPYYNLPCPQTNVGIDG
ncbi:hypothetical protein LCGC14_2760900, partial [marine sediment metagenome]